MLDYNRLKDEILAGGKLAEANPRDDMHESELQHFHGLLTQGDEFGALTGAFMLGLERGHRISAQAPAAGTAADVYRAMINQAAQECQDADLLDLVYKLLATGGEEAAV